MKPIIPLVAALALGLAACGEDSDENGEDTEQVPESMQEDTMDPALSGQPEPIAPQ